MTDVISGNCLCGKVAYEVENQFDNLFFCYCHQCRQLTGSSHAANLFIGPGAVKWLKGEENIRRFDLPERDFTKAFCCECGSGVPYLNNKGTKWIVPAGTLNTEPRYAQHDNIFCAEQTKWCHSGDASGNFDGFPDG